jgi:hypothetical protein
MRQVIQSVDGESVLNVKSVSPHMKMLTLDFLLLLNKMVSEKILIKKN